MSEKIGLFVDEFPILHSGHELCINYALSKVDKLITIIYDGDEMQVPLPVRANWLRELYPQMEVIESWFDMNGKKGATTKEQKRVISKSLGDREVSEFFSTNENIEHLCETLNLKNRIKPHIKRRMEDITRRVMGDNYRYKMNIDDLVYRDLIINVAFVGAQSTGKSTIDCDFFIKNIIHNNYYYKSIMKNCQITQKSL